MDKSPKLRCFLEDPPLINLEPLRSSSATAVFFGFEPKRALINREGFSVNEGGGLASKGGPLCELEHLVISNINKEKDKNTHTHIFGKNIFGENLRGSTVT